MGSQGHDKMGEFVKLDDQQIAQLANNLTKLLPISSALHNVARLYLAGTLDQIIPTSIFAYDGIIEGENAFVLAKQFKKYYNSYNWIVCGPTAEHLTENMFSALEQIVDWNNENSFTAIQLHIGPQLGNLIKKHGTLFSSEPALVYYMKMKELPQPQLQQSSLSNLNNNEDKDRRNDSNKSNVVITVRDLTVDEAAQVVKYWKFAQEGSLQEVRDCISFFDSTGFLVNNELVCWACHFADGAVHALYTMEEHRGKGYGKIVLQDLASKLAKKGMYATTQVEGDNAVSSKLMAAAGLTFSHSMRWTEFSPFTKFQNNQLNAMM